MNSAIIVAAISPSLFAALPANTYRFFPTYERHPATRTDHRHAPHRRRVARNAADPLAEAGLAGCAIEALVFDGTQGVLLGNPDFMPCIRCRSAPASCSMSALIMRLFRRYDLALSLLPGDRPTLYAWLAGRRSIGLLLNQPGQRWKQRLLDQWAPLDAVNTHTVRAYLALAGVLGIPAVPKWLFPGARKTPRLWMRCSANPAAHWQCCILIRNSATRCGISRAGSKLRGGCWITACASH